MKNTELNTYNEQLDSLFGIKGIADEKDVRKLSDVKHVLETLYKNKENRKISDEDYDIAIIECFAIFEDDDFNHDQFAKGFKDYMGISKLGELRDEFMQRFCGFLNYKLNSDSGLTINDFVRNIPGFTDDFFDNFIISETKKESYKAAIWLTCTIIDLFHYFFCKEELPASNS